MLKMKTNGARRKLAVSASPAGYSIGARYDTLLDAVKLVRRGLPFASMLHFHKTSGLTLERIKQVMNISEGSFARRRQAGRWSCEESQRMLRIARVFERAVSLFDGDRSDARDWLETPRPVLAGEKPLDLAQTEPGAREVEDLIGRIEHGVVS